MDIKKIPEDYNEGIGKYFNFRKEYEGRGGLLKINRFLPIRVKHKLLGTIYNKQANEYFYNYRNKTLDISKKPTL